MGRLQWKRRIGRAWGRLNQGRARRVILLYHAAGEGPWAIRPDAFREQMRWLADHGRICPLGELLSMPDAGELQVAVTFDDGYRCLRDEAMPILSEVGASATVYLNSGWIGDSDARASESSLGHYPDEEFLTWDKVQVLRDNGWTIGSHGLDHLDLTAEREDVVRLQLVDSKDAIEQRIGQPCEHFAYAWGRYSAFLQAEVQAAGYRTAVAGLHGPLRAASDRYALPRINIGPDYSFEDFVAVVRGDWDYLGLYQRARRHLR
jgi:peptidoglycan/xylan/chitin deacetylase (PgdA/CDA1 family)